jgi:acyl dehydratase
MLRDSLVTEELKKLIGAPLGPIVLKVEEGAIQRYAQAVGDGNPLYNDADFARVRKYGRLMAPPGFTGLPVKGELPIFELSDVLVKAGAPSRLLDGGVEFEFHEPVGAGDVLTATNTIVGITERETRLGKSLFTRVETAILNQNERLAMKVFWTLIQF